MTLADVYTRVEEIRARRGDDEAAHEAEDNLWEDVLRDVAEGGPFWKEKAAAALLTKGILFERWCA